MRKVLVLAVPAVALLAACGSSSNTHAAVSTPSQSAGSPPSISRSGAKQTIQVLELVSSSTYTPKGGQPRNGGPTGQPAGGDTWAFSSTLQQNGSRVGTDHVTLTFAADGTAAVNADESFANGQIVAHGSVPFDRTLTIPVVSGTGVYRGITGTITVVSQDPTHNSLTFGLV